MRKTLRDEISAWLLKPPYDGVIWMAWLYVVFACLYAGGGPFAGDLVCFDDRVRLIQIFDWLNGQSWHDRTIHRANAPEGFHTLWSRMVDLPVAGIIALFQSHVGQMKAGMIAAIIVPLVQTLMLFGATTYLARPLVGKPNAKLIVLFVLFSSAVNAEEFTLAGFHVGMIGHHSWYVLCTLMLFGAMQRLILISSLRHVLIGSLSVAGLLMIGIEALPLIVGACALLGLIGWLHNRPHLIFDAMRMTFIGAVFGLLLLPGNQPPEKLLVVSFAEASILGPCLMILASLYFAGQFLVLRRWGGNLKLSLALSIVIAALVAAIFVVAFPQSLNGAAASFTPEERHLAYTEHHEVITLYNLAQNKLDYLRMIVPPFLALCFALHFISKAPTRRQQEVAIFALGLLVMCFGMASTFSRYYHYLTLVTCPLLLAGWLMLSKKMARDEFRALKCFVLYFVLCPLWMWLIPGANYNQAFGSSVLLYPAKLQTEPHHCDTTTFTNFLSLRYGADKNIIMPMYKSDQFLLHTNMHIFFLANFPSQNKFIDAKTFYETGSPDEARQIAGKHGIDLVAICTKAYLVSTRSTLTNQLLKGHMSFGQLLVTGQPPDWLKPVEVSATTDWLLFEVDKARATAP